MALIDYVTEWTDDGSTGDDEHVDDQASGGRYEAIREEKGRILFLELMRNNPDLLRAKQAFSRRLFECGPVDADLYEIVMVAVAQANDCDYCAGSHRENLDLLLGMEPDAIEAIATGDFSSLPERERVVARFATRCIEDPFRVNEEDLDRLHDVGFDDAGILQLLQAIGSCDTANLIVNALNVHPADRGRAFRY